MPELRNIAANTAIGDNPAAYRLDEVLIKTHMGREVDIQEFVTDFKITESIYTPYLRLDMNVKDNANLLEELRLSGQERITVRFTKEDILIGQVKIEKEFVTTDYPIFSKIGHNLQVYSIAAISGEMFIGKFIEISRSVKGEIKNLIANILTRDLKISPDNIELSSELCTSFVGIIPKMKAIDAISWLLSRAFDANGGPWYCFETLLNGYKIISHTDVVNKVRNNEVHRTYTDGKLYTKDPAEDPDAFYKQKATRILDISSEIGLSKLIPMLSGAYAAKTEYLDIATKTRWEDIFDYSKEFEKMKWMDRAPVVSESFTFRDDEGLTTFYDVVDEQIPINSHAFGDTDNNFHAIAKYNGLAKARSYEENLDSIVHVLKLFGDPTLMPGYSIELKLTQAIAANVDRENVEQSSDYLRDEFLSGNYAVIGIEHEFSSEYYCTVKCKKDSYRNKL